MPRIQIWRGCRERITSAWRSFSDDPQKMQMRLLAFLGVILVAGVFVFAARVHAQSTLPDQADAENWTLNLIGRILGSIILFLGKIVLLLVNILINVSGYNQFVHAVPVQVGWKLVRDVANMFFIVILLVSAFSTIIGYKKFHYKSVLPKLLLMAILINFSKTLIGLMIDFSQVVMLTFVNAFAQAAGGNFVEILHLDKITKIKDTSSFGEIDTWKIVAASILAIVMLSVAMTMLVIMVAFIVARIVALWLLLILSPMAFFAWSLPDSLKKGVSAFTDGFWSRLSTMLIAGPVMAFFLWLTLAVAQQASGLQFADTLGASNSEISEATEFASAVGNATDIATFIVAIAMLLQGVEFAITSATAVSPSLGKFARGISEGGGVAVLAARGALRLGGGAARVAGATTGYVGGKAFEAVDRRADIRGKIGRIGMRVAPFGVGRERFAALAGYAGKQKAAAEARGVEARKGLSAEDQLKYFEAQGKSRNVHERRAAEAGKAQFATTGFGMKGLVKAEEAKLAGRKDLNEDEKKAWAQNNAEQQAAKFIKAGKEVAATTGDDAAMERLGEAIKKNPALAADYGELGEIASGRVEDERKFLETKSAAAFQDAGSATALLRAVGAINEDGSKNEESKGYQILQQRGGKRWEYVQKHLEKTNSERKTLLDAMKSGASDEQKASADAARWRVGTGSDGKAFSVDLARGKAPRPSAAAPSPAVPRAPGRREDIAAARARAVAAPRGSDEAVAARGDMVKAGATLAAAFPMAAAGGAFKDDESRDEYKKFVGEVNTNFATGGAEDLSWLSNLDTNSLMANAGGENQARSEMVAGLDSSSILSAYEAALASGNKDAQIKLGHIVNAIGIETQRQEKELKRSKISDAEVKSALANPGSDESAALVKRMADAGVKNPEQVLRSAGKGRDMMGDLYAIRSGRTRRAATAGRRAVAATGRGAAKVVVKAGAGISEAATFTRKEVAAAVREAKAIPAELREYRQRRFEEKSVAKADAMARKKAEAAAKAAKKT